MGDVVLGHLGLAVGDVLELRDGAAAPAGNGGRLYGGARSTARP
jgi:hypothetical protein